MYFYLEIQNTSKMYSEYYMFAHFKIILWKKYSNNILKALKIFRISACYNGFQSKDPNFKLDLINGYY